MKQVDDGLKPRLLGEFKKPLARFFNIKYKMEKSKKSILCLEKVSELNNDVGSRYSQYLFDNQDVVPSGPKLAIYFVQWVCDSEIKPFESRESIYDDTVFSGMAALLSILNALNFSEEKMYSLGKEWGIYIEDYARTKDPTSLRTICEALIFELKIRSA